MKLGLCCVDEKKRTLRFVCLSQVIGPSQAPPSSRRCPPLAETSQQSQWKSWMGAVCRVTAFRRTSYVRRVWRRLLMSGPTRAGHAWAVLKLDNVSLYMMDGMRCIGLHVWTPAQLINTWVVLHGRPWPNWSCDISIRFHSQCIHLSSSYKKKKWKKKLETAPSNCCREKSTSRSCFYSKHNYEADKCSFFLPLHASPFSQCVGGIAPEKSRLPCHKGRWWCSLVGGGLRPEPPARWGLPSP